MNIVAETKHDNVRKSLDHFVNTLHCI